MINNSFSSNKPNGFIRQHKSALVALKKLCDILIIISLFFIFLGANDYVLQGRIILILLTGFLTFEFFATINNLYGLRRGLSFLLVIKNIITGWLCVAFAVILLMKFSSIVDANQKKQVTHWLLVTPFIIIGWHLLIRLALNYARSIGKNTRRVAIIGATSLGLDLENILVKQTWLGFSFIGFYDDRAPSRERTSSQYVEGNIEKLIKKAKNNEMDFIFITLPMGEEKRIKLILDELRDTSIVVYLVPDLFVFDLLSAKVENFNGLPVISIFDTPHIGFDGFKKRLLDIVLSITILSAIFIPMLIIALGVKLTSPGPVLFVQRRYGFRGEEIFVWKFRTMRVYEDGLIVNQATHNDPRITKFGQFLRRTSLDELPQFINVLQGRMSIVGPRPHAVAHNEHYRRQITGYMQRHIVKPGITGLAQIRGFRGETDTLEKMEDRIRSDLEYIHTWSIWLDLEIFFATIFKGFRHTNAY
ncbi:MAG: undecaprenyl-phosphate glucose phosphotransferase [Methylococcales bacterium]|nr:undecaprenyl-phosphate glucose phosphotransferase [Methylococcales bacterium]